MRTTIPPVSGLLTGEDQYPVSIQSKCPGLGFIQIDGDGGGIDCCSGMSLPNELARTVAGT